MPSLGVDDLSLPDLRFVPVAALVPHEQPDAQRMEPLVRRLREQGVLKNPPVVAPLAEDEQGNRFVVLDGANRATAAHVAGLPHLVVQVVPYERPWVELSTWYHALAEFPRAEFEGFCARIPALECHGESLLHARALLARREALAYVVCGDGAVLTLHGGHDLQERNLLLNAIVDLYRGRARYYRVTTDAIDAVREGHSDVASLIVFPHFEPAEVVELATSGHRLPAGITRHLIRWRALRVNVPIERLADPAATLEAKNQWLEDWLQDKIARGQVRFYAEPTVLFDE